MSSLTTNGFFSILLSRVPLQILQVFLGGPVPWKRSVQHRLFQSILQDADARPRRDAEVGHDGLSDAFRQERRSTVFLDALSRARLKFGQADQDTFAHTGPVRRHVRATEIQEIVKFRSRVPDQAPVAGKAQKVRFCETLFAWLARN